MWSASEHPEPPQIAAPLARSEELLDLFFEYAPAAFAIFDREMRYLRASKRWRSESGLGDRDINGALHYEIFPGIPEHWKEAHRRGLRGETLRCDEDRFVRNDGTVEWIRWEIRPWYNSLGQVAGIIILSENITAQKLAEAALRESEQKFATVFNKASLPAILSHLPDYKIVDVNEAFTNLFGYTKEECVGRNSLEVGLRRNPEQRSMQIEEISRFGRLVDTETTLYSKWGLPLAILVNLNVFKLQGEEYALTAMHDLTERKRAEESMREQSAELKALAGRLQKVREEERARVARDLHDQIGQILTAAKMDVEMALRRSPRTDVHEALEAARTQIREATQALRTICTQLRPSVLDDLGIVAAIEWQAREFTHRTSIPCCVRLPGNELVVDSDRSTAIFRIFQEALTNIARHSRATKVNASLRQTRHKIVLTVQDNGRGFEHRNGRKNSFGILGMRERAEACGGYLDVSSKRDLGTTVLLEIPLIHEVEEGGPDADSSRR